MGGERVQHRADVTVTTLIEAVRPGPLHGAHRARGSGMDHVVLVAFMSLGVSVVTAFLAMALR